MIIDFHTHNFPDKIAEKAVSDLEKSSGYTRAINGTENDLLCEMQKAGVDVSVNQPILTNPQSFEKLVEKLHEKNLSQNKIINFAPFHPCLENKRDKLMMIKNLGFKGIKIHSYFQGVDLDDKLSIETIAICEELGLYTVVHAGSDASFIGNRAGAPEKIENLFRTLNPNKVVLSHMGAQGFWDDVEKYLYGLNAYFDTSFSMDIMPKEQFKKIILKHGADKILFGTDSPWKSQLSYVNEFLALNFDEQINSQILYKNALKILN